MKNKIYRESTLRSVWVWVSDMCFAHLLSDYNCATKYELFCWHYLSIFSKLRVFGIQNIGWVKNPEKLLSIQTQTETVFIAKLSPIPALAELIKLYSFFHLHMGCTTLHMGCTTLHMGCTTLHNAYGLHNIAYGLHNIAYGLHNIAYGLHNIGKVS